MEPTLETEQHEFHRKPGTCGDVSGVRYEIRLLMLLLLQAETKKEINDFYLASNMDGVGKFDDFVFKYTYEKNGIKKTEIIFLQSRFKVSKREMNFDSLFSQNEKSGFLLKTYLSSFKQIKHRFQKDKNHPIFKNKLEDSNYYLQTNATFNFNVGEDIDKYKIEDENILNFKEDAHYYKVKKSPRVFHALEKSLDFDLLIRELVQSVKNKTLNETSPIFINYRNFLLENVILKRSDTKFVFRKTFLGDETNELRNTFLSEITNKINKPRGELMQMLCMLELKLIRKRGAVEEKDSEQELPKKLIAHDEIEEFLEKFKIFDDQFNEEELEEYIIKKIQSTYLVSRVDAESIFSKVSNQLQEWRRKSNTYLTKSNYFKSAKQHFSKMSLIGLDSVNKAEIKAQIKDFDSEQDAFVQNLINEIPNHKILNVSTNNTVLTSGKVYNALERIPAYRSTDNEYKYMFFNSVFGIQEKVIEAFNCKDLNILVFVCKNIEEELQKIYQDLRKIIDASDDKKIIMIKIEKKVDTEFENTFSGSDKYIEIKDVV